MVLYWRYWCTSIVWSSKYRIHLSGSRALGIAASGEKISEASENTQKTCESDKGNVYRRRYVGTKSLVEKHVKHMKEILS